MDPHKGIPAAKQHGEVSVRIPIEESARGTGSLSRENTKCSPGPDKPLRPPQNEAFAPCFSFGTPKSRSVEQSAPPAADPVDELHNGRRPGSPNASAVGAHKTPSGDADAEKPPSPSSLLQNRKVWIFIEWTILIVAMGCLIASLTVDQLQNFVICGLEIWKWCLMVTVICCGWLVTSSLANLLLLLIAKHELLNEKVLYFVYGLKNSVRVCIWLGLVLLTWYLLFSHGIQRSPKTTKALNYVFRALASLLIGSVLWVVKILLVKILASSFHMPKFFDRIKDSVFHQQVLHNLSLQIPKKLDDKVGLKCPSQLCFSRTGKGKGKGNEGEQQGDTVPDIKPEKVSPRKMKKWINIISSSTIVDSIENSEGKEAEKNDQKITNEREAMDAANRIFDHIAKPGRNYIDKDDLSAFLSDKEIERLLSSIEGKKDPGKIEKSALSTWVGNAYNDRTTLAHTLNDTKTAVKQLHEIASVVVAILILIVALLLMGFATTKVLVFISSQLLLVAFMFGNTCKTLFESIVFVFVIHPYDVGDRCVIDGVQMIVDEMNILTTTFLRYDNEKIFYPNAVLLTKPISNFFRSPHMTETIEFSVDVSTPVESIKNLKAKIKAYIDSKGDLWHPEHSVVVKDIVNMNKMNMALYVCHTINFQNFLEKLNRRSDLVLELKKIFEELSIRYNLLPQEVHLNYTGIKPLPSAVEKSL